MGIDVALLRDVRRVGGDHQRWKSGARITISPCWTVSVSQGCEGARRGETTSTANSAVYEFMRMMRTDGGGDRERDRTHTSGTRWWY